MNRMALAGLLLSFNLAGGAAAQEPSVRIIAPADGARLDAMAQSQINYEIIPGRRGDHTHLYVDGREAAVLRQLKGSHTLDTLMAGPHTLCIRVVNKAHTPIGVEQCVKVVID